MLLQILLASILTLNLGGATTTGAPKEEVDSHAEASNFSTTKIDYSSETSLPNVTPSAVHIDNDNTSRHPEQESGRTIWGKQPFIEYTDISPHSKSITQIAFGKVAVEALQKSKDPQNQKNNGNILYLQPEVAKPVDNQLNPQPESKSNLVYVDGASESAIQNHQEHVNQYQHQNVFYLSSQNTAGVDPGQLLYYSQIPHVTQVSQNLAQLPEHDNVVYIAQNLPQRHANYGPPIATNYYQPNPVYLVSHPVPDYTTALPTKAPISHEGDIKTSIIDNKNEKEDDKKDKEGNDKHKEGDEKKKDDDEHTLVESNTAKAIIEEYERHYVKRRKNVDVKVDGETGTTPSPHISATTPPSITKAASLSKQPIIVADLDENNLETSDDKTYSTTQSTIKTVKTYSSLYHATQPLIVTQRPLGTTFLAPITAGVQLQPVETPEDKPKDDVLVEIQKSVPYYLGKFEFVQNDEKPTKNEEVKQNVNLGNNLLKYSIERLPNPQAFISEFTQAGPQVLTQLTYTTLRNPSYDQEQVSGQLDYKIQDAPYKNILVQNSQQSLAKITKLEKVPEQEELPQLVHVQDHVQKQSQIIPVPVKTISDYVQKQPLQIPYQPISPITPEHPRHNQHPILLEPYAQVTKLIPQYLPLKHHQEVQKVPMKTYTYAPSYQPSHHHNPYQPHHFQHNLQHNYQISHVAINNLGNKKSKNLATNHQNLRLATPSFLHNGKFNNYIGMRAPKIVSNPVQSTRQHLSQANTANHQGITNGPPFKASQHLQTIHEYLPTTQLTEQQIRKYRNPRQSFESSIRLEYGFMPPLIPSIEIDEFGKPITKSEE